MLGEADGSALASLLGGAPSLAIYRHLWRIVVRESEGRRNRGDSLATLFAIPVVIVASASGSAKTPVRLPGVLADPGALAGVLRDHGALAGNQTLALASALVGTDAIDLGRLPGLLAASARVGGTESFAPIALAPVAIEVHAGEAAHLRYLVGSAIAATGATLTRDGTMGRWGLPLSKALIAQLAEPGVTLVALPRPAMSLPVAVARGSAAHREVALQLFASHALRELRAQFGEPIAVISAHAAMDAPGRGELRLSLSSPLSPRDAQGFRCPLHPGEAVADVATMLVDLLRDCRVSDIRIVSGVHADRETVTGGPLLFKPDTIPRGARVLLQ